MKRTIGIIFLIISFFSVDATISYIKKNKESLNNISEIRAVYISYLEYYNNFYSGGKTINQAKIEKMIDNIEMDGFNTIILHVSPFSDSIYESEIMPYSHTLTGTEGKNPGFDYLEYFITIAHRHNMLLYAWLNPYRISFDNNIEKISKENPAYKLLNTSSVMVNKEGIYYNPSSEIVKNLIVHQVEEIINKYDVDGIHFDDYFYMQKDIDQEEYQNYQQNNGEMSLKEFRLHHTNDLIKRIYKLIKMKKANIIFSIAPDGNINNNYQYHYADVKTWLNNENYIDMIMPQLYYGFNNEYLSFMDSLKKWQEIRGNQKIKIIPVLAFYKSGVVDSEAGKGKNEWQENDNILKKQVEIIRNNDLSGYALFRYDFMYDKKYQNNLSVKELENLKKIN